ncbi:hypothetical protein HMPREF3187_00134 [Aerococcus christensenii]|uniref:3-oxoacyl-[acyl-carrier-protein] reductase domain protein n=1 Tax=Aerococcus christensenii TaxID=87541 RepID=A0A133Y4F7_9LACT|nr:hypothetical protein HMPREF3187_00134 [Aerococcus christensenii]
MLKLRKNLLKQMEKSSLLILMGKLQKQLPKKLRQMVAYQADVSDYERAQEIIADVVEKWGKVDVLINNAGITRDRSFKKMSKKEWD